MYKAAKLAGTCRSGSDRVRGSLYHLVPLQENGIDVSWYGKALYGLEPGRRSNGWYSDIAAANCPKCLKRCEANNG